MSYIGMELDALNLCPDVGDACGLTAAQVCHGLMRMWAFVFRAEQATLDAMQVQGFMYGNERAVRALTVFGFLEAAEKGLRVKGSSRLLGVKNARRAGGLAAKKNLVPGAYQKKKAAEGLAEAAAQTVAEDAPGLALRSSSALTPTTNNQLPTTEKKQGAGVARSAPPPSKRRRKDAGGAAPPNPRVATLKTALLEAYLQVTGSSYEFQGRDWGALAELAQSKSTDEEIVRRWRKAWTSSGFDRPTDIFDFRAKWNRYGAPAGAGPPRDITRGYANATETFDSNEFQALNGPGARHG